MDRQPETIKSLLDALVGDDDARALFRQDPDGYLEDHGFGDLPDALVPQAVVHYADVAPLEVAERLAPYVQAHSPVEPDEPLDPPADPFEAIAAAGEELADLPVDTDRLDEDDAAPAEPEGAEALDDGEGKGFAGHDEHAETDTDEDLDGDTDIDEDLDFGAGHGAGAPALADLDLSEGLAEAAPAEEPVADDAELDELAPAQLGADPVDLDELPEPDVATAEPDDVDGDDGPDDWDDVI